MVIKMANEVVKTIMEQVDWRELRMAKFNFMADDEHNSLTLNKASKTMVIHYDVDNDTYTVDTFSRHGRLDKHRTEMTWEELKPAIQSHFKFEYVMRGMKVRIGKKRYGF
jgi:hypothetical protein